MKPISQLRFNSLAGSSRSPLMPLIVKELEWFEEGNEKLLGLIALDLPDLEFACYVFGRDAKGRFRAVWLDLSLPTFGEARSRLEKKMFEYVSMPDEEFYQALNKDFQALTTLKGHSPSRELIATMMHYFEDVDGNFVEQFQLPDSSFSLIRRTSARFWRIQKGRSQNSTGWAFWQVSGIRPSKCCARFSAIENHPLLNQ